LLFRPSREDAAKNRQALAAFCEVTGAGSAMAAPADRELVALLPTDRSHILLTARRATASAYMVALRAHFLQCGADDLYDPVYEYAGRAA
jgi:hypothetical protein